MVKKNIINPGDCAKVVRICGIIIAILSIFSIPVVWSLSHMLIYSLSRWGEPLGWLDIRITDPYIVFIVTIISIVWLVAFTNAIVSIIRVRPRIIDTLTIIAFFGSSILVICFTGWDFSGISENPLFLCPIALVIATVIFSIFYFMKLRNGYRIWHNYDKGHNKRILYSNQKNQKRL